MPRPLAASRARREEYLEIKKICVIATEDSKTGGFEYFNELAEIEKYRFLRKYAFKLHIIPSVDGKTSPRQVLENLKEIIKKLDLHSEGATEEESKEEGAGKETTTHAEDSEEKAVKGAGNKEEVGGNAATDVGESDVETKKAEDKFWIVCDVDRWKPDHIDEVIKLCNELKVDWAFSHPCFEIWIVYHQEQFEDKKYSDSQECKKAAVELLKKRGDYKNLITSQQIEYAVKRAEASHRPKSDLWPKTQGTHVYKIIKFLME